MNREENRRYGKAHGGFTLIEVLLVVAILGILAAVVVVNLAGRTEDASIKATRASIAAVCTGIDLYEIDNGRLPPSIQALVQNAGEANWKGPYVKGGLPNDAWGTTLGFTQRGSTDYEVRSAGPDKQMGSADDLTNATNM